MTFWENCWRLLTEYIFQVVTLFIVIKQWQMWQITEEWRQLYFLMNWSMHIRDVNSQEIAFPGRESQFPGLDRDSWFCLSMYSTFYGHDWSWITGMGPRVQTTGPPSNDRLIASAERQVTIIPLTIGPVFGRSLVTILGSWEIPFPGSRKKIRLSRLKTVQLLYRP